MLSRSSNLVLPFPDFVSHPKATMALVEAREANGSDLISALHLSQQAPAILGHNPANAGVTSSRSSADTAEEYGRIERLFLACLRTGDDKSAHACLDRLSERFGPSNERVMGLRGLYEEATAKDNAALAKCLEEYEKILANNPVNVVRAESSNLRVKWRIINSQCSIAHYEASGSFAALTQPGL
jgi:enoyl-CoA hydratase/carnithine racemase